MDKLVEGMEGKDKISGGDGGEKELLKAQHKHLAFTLPFF